jgi:hypothetical protein
LIPVMVKHAEKPEPAVGRRTVNDKVSTCDPAAAPLRTDEEAAGTPMPRDAAGLSALREAKGPARPGVEGPEPDFPAKAVFALAGLMLVLAGIAAGYFR